MDIERLENELEELREAYYSLVEIENEMYAPYFYKNMSIEAACSENQELQLINMRQEQAWEAYMKKDDELSALI